MSAKRVVFLFPGQGSQYPGMGRELAESFTEARETFASADTAAGVSISSLCFEGPESELVLTENTQPAILSASVAAVRALESQGLRPWAVAGHSLGEYAALVAAQSLDFADAVRLVRKRGRYMQEAVPVGVGAMAAVLGLDPAAVEDLCAEIARGETVVAANYNAPDQTVVAGSADAVRRAVALAEARGAKRAVMLPVSAPFHSPLMEPARVRLEADLQATRFGDLSVPLVSNVDADWVRGAAAARSGLVRQVTAPVRWTESIRRLIADGAEAMVEVGPGRVLSGLVRKIDRSLALYNVEDMKSLERTVQALGGTA